MHIEINKCFEKILSGKFWKGVGVKSGPLLFLPVSPTTPKGALQIEPTFPKESFLLPLKLINLPEIQGPSVCPHGTHKGLFLYGSLPISGSHSKNSLPQASGFSHTLVMVLPTSIGDSLDQKRVERGNGGT